MKRFLLITICFALASVLHSEHVPAQLDLRAVAERAKVSHSIVPRKILAFYYPWYGNPKVAGGSGELSHWSGIDENKRQVASSTNYPALGPYDSHDPALMAQHCSWAKRAGIDGFIVSWWGVGSFEDRAMPRLLDVCDQAGMQLAVYYERVPDPRNPTSAAKEIVRVLHEYGKHPSWLAVDGRPAIFVYGRAVREIGLRGWLAVVSEVNHSYPGGAIFIGDQMDRSAARIFDGIHTYNTAASLKNKRPPEMRSWARNTYATWVKTADAFGRISTITVIPGYDDTKIRQPGLRVERMDGAAYATQWNAAIDADPHWVLITSFNEWHEGSEIEPSAENGDKYLTLTAEFAARFKSKGTRQTASVPVSEVQISEVQITEREQAALRNVWSGIGGKHVGDN